MLSARNIYKSFDGRKILDGVDIDIAPGQISCIIGPSGTGKTTLLRALCMLDLQHDGTMDRLLRKWESEPGKTFLRVANPAKIE